MVTREQRPIEIRGGNANLRNGVVNVLIFDQSERNRRALKMLGLFWGLAVVTVPIPIMHLVLVPAFLIAGPIMAYRKRKVTSEIESAGGTCPACAQDITFAMEADDTIPKRTYCPKCNAPVELIAGTA